MYLKHIYVNNIHRKLWRKSLNRIRNNQNKMEKKKWKKKWKRKNRKTRQMKESQKLQLFLGKELQRCVQVEKVYNGWYTESSSR